MWAKCDMLCTVSLDRLNKPYRKTARSGRKFVTHFLDQADIDAVLKGVRAYLQL